MWPAPRRACASRLCGCVDAPDRKSVYLSSWRTYASGGERAQRKSVPEQLLRRETGALLYKLDAKVTRPKCGLAACKTLAKHLSLAGGHPAVAPKQYQGRLLILDVLERHLLIRDSGGRSRVSYRPLVDRYRMHHTTIITTVLPGRTRAGSGRSPPPSPSPPLMHALRRRGRPRSAAGRRRRPPAPPPPLRAAPCGRRHHPILRRASSGRRRAPSLRRRPGASPRRRPPSARGSAPPRRRSRPGSRARRIWRRPTAP